MSRERKRSKGVTHGGLPYTQKRVDEILAAIFDFSADLGAETVQSATIRGASATVSSIDSPLVYVVVSGNGEVEVVASTASGKKYSRRMIFRDQSLESTRDYRD